MNNYDEAMTESSYDVAIIGGGIAGVSAAANLAGTHSVVLLEQEGELAHHTTSRSAAVFIENEGGPVFHRLATASRSFFEESPGADAPLFSPLPVLKVGNDAMAADFAAEAEIARQVTPAIRFVEGAEIQEICPVLNADVITAGLFEPTGCSIDVMGLHQLFLRTAKAAGAAVRLSARLRSGERTPDGWKLETADGPVHAQTIVNAAGAWGDVVAQSCGVKPVGLQPMRRTAFTAPAQQDPAGWPLVYSGIPELECYFKPEAGEQLLCSLSEENPSEPMDARPEEIDVALAIERIQTVSTLQLRSVRTTWAGLRTFSPDRNPVFGWDDSVDGFLWLVGQGGCGIVSSPAAGSIVGALVRGEELPSKLADLGLTVSDLAPRR